MRAWGGHRGPILSIAAASNQHLDHECGLGKRPLVHENTQESYWAAGNLGQFACSGLHSTRNSKFKTQLDTVLDNHLYLTLLE